MLSTPVYTTCITTNTSVMAIMLIVMLLPLQEKKYMIYKSKQIYRMKCLVMVKLLKTKTQPS